MGKSTSIIKIENFKESIDGNKLSNAELNVSIFRILLIWVNELRTNPSLTKQNNYKLIILLVLTSPESLNKFFGRPLYEISDSALSFHRPDC